MQILRGDNDNQQLKHMHKIHTGNKIHIHTNTHTHTPVFNCCFLTPVLGLGDSIWQVMYREL